MTIEAVIRKVNQLVPNNKYKREDFIEWLNRIDTKIKLEIIDIRLDADKVEFNGYDNDTDEDTKLIVPEPYDELYIFYLKSCIEKYNNENNRFNQSITIYNDLLTQFRNWYNRQHEKVDIPLRW